MSELSTQHNKILLELFNQAETKEENTLVLTYRELHFLHQQTKASYADSVLCKLLKIAEIEAYDYVQKVMAERQDTVANSV